MLAEPACVSVEGNRSPAVVSWERMGRSWIFESDFPEIKLGFCH